MRNTILLIALLFSLIGCDGNKQSESSVVFQCQSSGKRFVLDDASADVVRNVLSAPATRTGKILLVPNGYFEVNGLTYALGPASIYLEDSNGLLVWKTKQFERINNRLSERKGI